eukprot:7038793-Pyramimonas_sp.AAC.1
MFTSRCRVARADCVKFTSHAAARLVGPARAAVGADAPGPQRPRQGGGVQCTSASGAAAARCAPRP